MLKSIVISSFALEFTTAQKELSSSNVFILSPSRKIYLTSKKSTWSALHFIMIQSIVRQCVTVVAFLALLSSGARAVVLLPRPLGPYNVDIITMKLVDLTRLDLFAPSSQPRAVMVSAFYPVSRHCESKSCRFIDYMPPATAAIEDQDYSQYGLPSGTFEKLEIQLCRQDVRVHQQRYMDHYPIVLFSPAMGTSRLLSNAIIQSVASSGYVVISIDHPYDADVVEYPDGWLVFAANISSDAQVDLALATRAEDASFVLDQLAIESVANQLIPGAKTGLNVSKAAMFGHSLGGAATAAAMLNDNRIVGGLNLDGSLFGPVVTEGLGRPFMMLGHQGKNQSTDDTWASFWRHLRGWKLELEMEKAQHYTFSDVPLLVKILGLKDDLPPDTASLLGTIDGSRALQIIWKYVTAFLDFTLNGVETELLEKPDPRYPEVEFVAKEDDCWN